MGGPVVGRQVLPSIPPGFRIVSPYLAATQKDIIRHSTSSYVYIGIPGTVRFTDFTDHHPDIPRVVSFIKEKTGVSLPTVQFNTVSMMAVEWSVVQRGGDIVSSTMPHYVLLACNTLHKDCMHFNQNFVCMCMSPL